MNFWFQSLSAHEIGPPSGSEASIHCRRESEMKPRNRPMSAWAAGMRIDFPDGLLRDQGIVVLPQAQM
jgi:hypothetical protein